MDEKKVVITIGKNGEIKSEAFGFKGSSCEKATAFLSDLFGEKKTTYKDSYYEDGDKIADGLPSGWCG